MTSLRFDPETDFAPMPFDERVCLRAAEIKKLGLQWRPQVGCFVWDPDEFIGPPSPFPLRIYFILSLARFIKIFETIDRMTAKLVWLPTWHQAQLLCRQLGIPHEVIEKSRQYANPLSPVEELLHVYGLIVDALKQENHSRP